MFTEYFNSFLVVLTSALKKLKGQLTCSICLGRYTDPKQLQCNHAYCQQCLMGLVQQDQQGQLTLTCPTCRQVTRVPASGVAGLQADFRVNQLLEIVEEHKKPKVATAPQKEENASASSAPHENITIGCPKHGGREIELYCNTCEETICFRCIKKGENHHSHDYEDLNKAIEGKITASLEPMENQNYGNVGPPDPSKCSVTGKGVHTAAVGKKSTVTLNFISQPSKVLQDAITCELVSEIAGTTVKGIVERRGHSPYKISYKPTIKGRHQLHIKIDSQHIIGSPFPVNAWSPVQILGNPILTIDCYFLKPMGVAVNQKGEVVVIGYGGNCTVFSPSGERLRSFVTHGSGHGQFQYSLGVGVAVDGKENILVADTDNNRMQKFTAQGEFLTAVGTQGSGPLQFDHPCGIVFNASNGRVYVVDSSNGRIQILNSDLSYVGTFGERGTGKGQFNYPRCIACNNTGKVYVADTDNHRIQVFTAEGECLGGGVRVGGN